ncbi:MAG: hypothetical protein AB7H43_01605 [Acidimicrobiia bacterium]
MEVQRRRRRHRGLLATIASVALSLPLVIGGATPASAAAGSFVLHPNETLTANQSLVQVDGATGLVMARLTMQTDGNLVLRGVTGTVMWDSSTWGNPGSILRMQSDGNLVIYAPGNVPIWWTGTSGNPGGLLILQWDANVVVYSAGGTPIWANGVYAPIQWGENAVTWTDWPTLVCGEICFWAVNVDLFSSVRVFWQHGYFVRELFLDRYYNHIWEGSSGGDMRITTWSVHNVYGTSSNKFGASNYACIATGDYFQCRDSSPYAEWMEWSPPSNHRVSGRFLVYALDPMVAPSTAQPTYPVVS